MKKTFLMLACAIVIGGATFAQTTHPKHNTAKTEAKELKEDQHAKREDKEQLKEAKQDLHADKDGSKLSKDEDRKTIAKD